MKTILVTGGTRGLGLEICKQSLIEGYAVIACGRTKTAALQELIEKYPDRCFFESLDLSEVDRVRENTQAILKKHKSMQVYGLINNAAIGSDGVLATMHDSEIANLLNVNVTSAILVTKYVLRSMLMRGQGRIINISSIIASTGYSGLSVYASSKSALEGFTKSLAREVGKVGINVNAVAPGYMKTDMTSGITEDKLATIMRRSPLNKLPAPEDVAKTVIFLLGDAGDMVTGSTLTVDAGNTV